MSEWTVKNTRVKHVSIAGANADNGCCVYRFFDVDDNLLYVGSAVYFNLRFSQHVQRRARWVPLAARALVTWYPSAMESEVGEEATIIAERPLFNEEHNRFPDAPQRLFDYLSERDRLDLLPDRMTRRLIRAGLTIRDDRAKVRCAVLFPPQFTVFKAPAAEVVGTLRKNLPPELFAEIAEIIGRNQAA